MKDPFDSTTQISIKIKKQPSHPQILPKWKYPELWRSLQQILHITALSRNARRFNNCPKNARAHLPKCPGKSDSSTNPGLSPTLEKKVTLMCGECGYRVESNQNVENHSKTTPRRKQIQRTFRRPYLS